MTAAAAVAGLPAMGDAKVQADESGRCYVLQAGSDRFVVDPCKKGEPGDIVVVWDRKKGPMVVRRLARCTPYNTFHFRALDTGCVFELPCDKVSAIHAVVVH